MTDYRIIDLENFSRKDYYGYFMSVDTSFEMTVKIDVTQAVKKCKDESINFYAYTIFNLVQSANKIPNFRYGHLDGQLVEWQELVPTFTSFNQETTSFYSLWLEKLTDYQTVDREYKKLTKEYAHTTAIAPQESVPANVINISAIPWVHFDHFSSYSGAVKNDLTPMITIGKYERVGTQLLMPVNIKVHHATVDGYHVSLFFKALQEHMNLE